MEDKKKDSGQSRLESFFGGKGFYIVLFPVRRRYRRIGADASVVREKYCAEEHRCDRDGKARSNARTDCGGDGDDLGGP